MFSVWYFGTPEQSAEVLKTILASTDFRVSAIFCQPDKPVGRKHVLETLAVKQLALTQNIQVFQPETLKSFLLPGDLERPDFIVVYQYGLIIPKNILNLPKFGAVNIHPSFLPKYRGATPMQSAILASDTEIGITIMLMDEKMDHGPILKQVAMPIRSDELYESVSARATKMAENLLLKTLIDFADNKIQPQNQNDADATFCQNLVKEDGKINWELPARTIFNQYRAFHSWPGVFTFWQNKRLKLIEINLVDTENAGQLQPAEIRRSAQGFLVGTKLGNILITKLQLEGKSAVAAKEFAAGHANFDGSVLI